MFSTRKKRQSNRRFLSQLDDFDQNMITGNAACESQEIIVVGKGTNGRVFTVGSSSKNIANNESTVNVQTLERCFNEKIDREMSKNVDRVEDRIQNANLTALVNIVAPIFEVAIRSINASSGRDVANVSANPEHREQLGINTSFENASGNNNILHVSNANDETRHNIPNGVNELSVLETHEAHTHHMVTGQTAQSYQIPEFPTGRILTPQNPLSHQHQNLSTQVSQDNSLPMVEQTPRNQNSDANISINCPVHAIAGIATQQRPQTATMPKPVSTSSLIFVGKTKNLNCLKTFFTQCSKCNQR